MEVAQDPKPAISEAATAVLRRCCDVITNPDVVPLIDDVIAANMKPDKLGEACKCSAAPPHPAAATRGARAEPCRARATPQADAQSFAPPPSEPPRVRQGAFLLRRLPNQRRGLCGLLRVAACRWRGAGLDRLVATTFVSPVDEPTLAIIVPVLTRGLRARGNAAAVRKAALVVDTMCKLVVDPADMGAFAPELLSELRTNAAQVAAETERAAH
eukprot:1450974-Prymnesium_polylepis.1